MARERESGGAAAIGWLAMGIGVGLVAGFVAGEWVGNVGPGRVRRTATRLRTPKTVTLSAADAARSARAALGTEPALGGLAIDVVAVARGVVELHGWVPSRSQRTLAGRVVRRVAGMAAVQNALRVRGEDDLEPAPWPVEESA